MRQRFEIKKILEVEKMEKKYLKGYERKKIRDEAKKRREGLSE